MQTSLETAACAQDCAAAPATSPPLRTARPAALAQPRSVPSPAPTASRRCLSADVHPQRQRVDEQTDQALNLRARPVGNRRTDHDVVLPRKPRQQRAPCRQERREQRRPARTAERFELAPSAPHRFPPRRTRPHNLAAADADDPWASDAPPGCPPAPLASTPACSCSTAPLSCSPLPRRIIRVLDRQRRQRIGRVRRETRRYSALSSRSSTPIDQPSETMWCIVIEQHVLRSADAIEPAANQRPGLQIERRVASSACEPRQLAARHRRRRAGRVRAARSRCPPAAICWAGSPPRRRTSCATTRGARQAIQALAQRRAIQLAAQPQPQRHVVRLADAVHLRQEPQPLLRERQRQRPLAVAAARSPAACSRDRIRSTAAAPNRQDRVRERLRKASARRRDSGASRDSTRTAKQRVTAQLEEVVVTPDPLDVEHLAPDLRQRCSISPCRRLRTRATAYAAPSGAGSALRSSLPFGVSGNASSAHVRRRHHVLRQRRRAGASRSASTLRSPVSCAV